jgi:hypothetical protein
MTTVINTPGNNDSGSNAAGLIVGIVVLIIVGALFFVYVLPRIKGSNTPNSVDVNLNLPTGSANNSGTGY